ncbi:MAG: hypothetical protein L0Z54_05095 [Thermoplasmata archaeon]|nr:hypothetical protein [Thermoplasmata archaeon]
MDDDGVAEVPGTAGGTGALFFENLAQRRIIEVLGLQPGENVFIPYLEVVLKKPKERFACDLCRLVLLGLIEQVDRDDGGDSLYPFVLEYHLTPMGRMVFKGLQLEDLAAATPGGE